MHELIKVKEGDLSLTVFDGNKACYVIDGGDDRNLLWEDYVQDFADKYQPHINLVKKAIEELGWVGDTADKRANDTVFEFSDGDIWGFTWRAWGDLMQAIVNKREGYMTYYM